MAPTHKKVRYHLFLLTQPLFWGLPYFFLPQFLQSSAKFLLISEPVNNLSTLAQYAPLFSILLEIWLIAHVQRTDIPEKISSEENDKENHTRAELQHTSENNAATFKLQLFHTGHRKTIVGGRQHFSENYFCCGFTEIIEKIASKSLDKNLAEIGSACVYTFCRLFQIPKFLYSVSKIHSLKGTASFHKLSFSAFFWYMKCNYQGRPYFPDFLLWYLWYCLAFSNMITEIMMLVSVFKR